MPSTVFLFKHEAEGFFTTQDKYGSRVTNVDKAHVEWWNS